MDFDEDSGMHPSSVNIGQCVGSCSHNSIQLSKDANNHTKLQVFVYAEMYDRKSQLQLHKSWWKCRGTTNRTSSKTINFLIWFRYSCLKWKIQFSQAHLGVTKPGETRVPSCCVPIEFKSEFFIISKVDQYAYEYEHREFQVWEAGSDILENPDIKNIRIPLMTSLSNTWVLTIFRDILLVVLLSLLALAQLESTWDIDFCLDTSSTWLSSWSSFHNYL